MAPNSNCCHTELQKSFTLSFSGFPERERERQKSNRPREFFELRSKRPESGETKVVKIYRADYEKGGSYMRKELWLIAESIWLRNDLCIC